MCAHNMNSSSSVCTNVQSGKLHLVPIHRRFVIRNFRIFKPHSVLGLEFQTKQLLCGAVIRIILEENIKKGLLVCTGGVIILTSLLWLLPDVLAGLHINPILPSRLLARLVVSNLGFSWGERDVGGEEHVVPELKSEKTKNNYVLNICYKIVLLKPSSLTLLLKEPNYSRHRLIRPP